MPNIKSFEKKLKLIQKFVNTPQNVSTFDVFWAKIDRFLRLSIVRDIKLENNWGINTNNGCFVEMECNLK